MAKFAPMIKEQITHTSKNELQQFIDESVFNALKKLKLKLQTTEERTSSKLTRKEVSQLYHISLPTLLRYEKEGIIQGYRIGSRVLFDRDQIEKSLTIRNFQL